MKTVRLPHELRRIDEFLDLHVMHPAGASALTKVEILHAAWEEMHREAAEHKRTLRSIAFKANELAQDGLMAKGTGCQIRDKALLALGARGDEAIRIIRGDYE